MQEAMQCIEWQNKAFKRVLFSKQVNIPATRIKSNSGREKWQKTALSIYSLLRLFFKMKNCPVTIIISEMVVVNGASCSEIVQGRKVVFLSFPLHPLSLYIYPYPYPVPLRRGT